ncbi:MAG TPA: EamA family transporter [Actinomycetota bacterium]|nr:EamA family transporter [Actinomycetota bacterium]
MRSPAEFIPSSPRWRVWLALATIYLVWGSTYLAIRVVVETMPPLLSAGVRFLIAGALMWAFLAARRGLSAMRVSVPELLASSLVGTLLLLGGNGLVTIAEVDVPSGLAALIIASVPLWVILLRKLFAERVPISSLLAVPLGFAGVALLLLPGNRPAGVGLFGPLLLVAASLFWASGSFFSSKLPLPRDPLVTTTYQMLGGAVSLFAGGLIRGEGSGIQLSEISLSSTVALLYLIVAGSLLAFTAYVWLLQNAPISKVATYAYVNPVVAMLLGWLILSESMTGMMIVGAGVVIASVAFTVSGESRLAATKEREIVDERVPNSDVTPMPVVEVV